jgi:uncharacterized Zn finger protein (UPF0148 family)
MKCKTCNRRRLEKSGTLYCGMCLEKQYRTPDQKRWRIGQLLFEIETTKSYILKETLYIQADYMAGRLKNSKKALD